MGAMDHAKSFLNIVRTVQLDDIRTQLAQPPLALVVADDTRAAQQFAFALAGGDAPDEVASRATMTVASPQALEELAMGPTPYDVVVLVDPTPETRRNRGLQRLIAGGAPTAVLAIYTRPTPPDPGLPSLTVARLDDLAAVNAVRARLVTLLPAARRLAWGRAFAGFRKPISDLLVNETARANAQFAIMADLGARIPIFGGVTATGADFLVLTKNQLVLAYQLAAMNGRELDDPALDVHECGALFSRGPRLARGGTTRGSLRAGRAARAESGNCLRRYDGLRCACPRTYPPGRRAGVGGRRAEGCGGLPRGRALYSRSCREAENFRRTVQDRCRRPGR